MTCRDHISVNHFGQVAQIAVGEGESRGEHTTKYTTQTLTVCIEGDHLIFIIIILQGMSVIFQVALALLKVYWIYLFKYITAKQYYNGFHFTVSDTVC